MISENDRECARGFAELIEILKSTSSPRRIAIECYPGVLLEPLLGKLVPTLAPQLVLKAVDAMLPPHEIEAKFESMLGNDPVFGRMEARRLEEFFDPALMEHSQGRAKSAD